MEAWRGELRITADILRQPAGVACLDAAVVGFYTLLPGDEAWELDNLWVDPGSMHQGVGRALLAHALDAARAAGARLVRIDADPNAAAFYRACGARPTGAVSAPIAGEAGRQRPQFVIPLSADA